MAANGISTLPTKQERQLAKLDIAEARRQGYTTVVPTGSQQVSSDYGGVYPNIQYVFGSLKVVSDGAGNTYLVFLSPIPTIQNYLYDGAPIHNIRFAGTDHFDAVSIVDSLVDCSTLVGFPQAGAVGYLLSASLGVTSNNNVGWVEIPNGRFEGSGIPDTLASFYRTRNVLDITQLPDTYNGNVPNGDDNPNLGELTLTPGATQTGIRKVTYTGYHNDDVAFTDTATATASTTANDFIISSIAENTTVLYTGYLLGTYTGDWTFTLTGDDSSYLWIGADAVSGYTTVNRTAFANYNTVGTVTVAITAGTYYPVRILYGNGPSTGYLNLTYAHTGQTTTNNFTGKLFSPGVSLVVGRPWVES